MHPTAFDGDFFGQTAAAAAQADKVHVFGEVVVAARAGRYVVVYDVRLDNDVLTDFDVVHAFADGIDHAGELVSHRYGSGLAGNRVRMTAGRDENRAFHKFVQVGAADAAPRDIDADGAGGDGRFGDVFDADIAFIVKTCCFHCNAPCFQVGMPSEKCRTAVEMGMA
ncbi:hypothetical protein NEIPOLOT_02115 [Neisseria polysaccharea ATCC 43768]|nr:hypothetical protein NEIPOLOT_02115 [Neisseria polysaccharea ATCC 43768]